MGAYGISLTGVINEARDDANLSVAQREALRKLQTSEANKILADEGLLEGKPKYWHVSKTGHDLGIREGQRTNDRGESYTAILYSEHAKEEVVAILLKRLLGNLISERQDAPESDAQVTTQDSDEGNFYWSEDQDHDEISVFAIDDELNDYLHGQTTPDANIQKNRRPKRRARLSDRELRKHRRDVKNFIGEWRSFLTGSHVALERLLNGDAASCFASLVVEDQARLNQFTGEVSELFEKSGQGPRGKALVTTLSELAERYDIQDCQFVVGDYEGVDLPEGRLLVFDGLRAFLDQYEEDRPALGMDANNAAVDRAIREKAVIDALKRESLGRYVLLIGADSDLQDLCALDAVFAQSFGSNRIQLEGLEVQSMARIYLRELDPEVREQTKEIEGFGGKLMRHIAFNQRLQPLRGAAYAKHLAKYSNRARKPILECPENGYDYDRIQSRLDAVVGLEAVKRTLHELEGQALFNMRAEAYGREDVASCKHMLFVGNPGTGKTMMARIFADLLPVMGVIKLPEGKDGKEDKKGKFKEVTASDIFSMYVSQSEVKAKEIIEEARGGVLFVDEAYSMMGHVGEKSDATSQVISVFVKAMDDYKDELVIIFAGYEKEMARFMESNPGLKSRTPYTFRFEDYSTEELIELFSRNLRDMGYDYERESVEVKLRDLFERNRNFRDFGNGRFVRNVVSAAKRHHATATNDDKVEAGKLFVISGDDIPSQNELMGVSDWSFKGARELLKPLIGMDQIKETVLRFEKEVAYREQMRLQGCPLPRKNMHMLLTGNPGTGKTTLARILGKILYNVGVLPTNKFLEVEGHDLAKVGSGNQLEVTNYLKDAMGGVLFIDEAYAILSSPGRDSIIATLVKAMEDHKGDFVVMFAGYRKEMKAFTEWNPGLESRIGYKFDFQDYREAELQEIFELKIKSAGLEITEAAQEKSRNVFRFFQGVRGIGNGRFAGKLLDEAISLHAQSASAANLKTLDADDIPSIEHMASIVAVNVVSCFENNNKVVLQRRTVHELGHAICLLELRRLTNIRCITIREEGTGAAAYVAYTPKFDIHTANDIKSEIVAALGGLAAEEIVLGEFGVGGTSDLARATETARAYVTKTGLSSVGLLVYGDVDVHELPESVREAMSKLLDDAFAKARRIIVARRNVLIALYEKLMKERTISGECVIDVWNQMVAGQ